MEPPDESVMCDGDVTVEELTPAQQRAARQAAQEAKAPAERAREQRAEAASAMRALGGSAGSRRRSCSQRRRSAAWCAALESFECVSARPPARVGRATPRRMPHTPRPRVTRTRGSS